MTTTTTLLESHADHPNRAEGRSAGEGDDAASMFAGTTPRLFAIGLRILRDTGEAEDVVQEAWLRWARTDHSSTPPSPPAGAA